MRFFEQQARARRHSVLLLLYFTAAVLLFILAIDLLAWWGVRGFLNPSPSFGEWLLSPIGLGLAGAVLLLILGGTIKRLWELRAGGEALARALQAREIDPASVEGSERRLLNVIEEMAIASGMPPPTTYVLDDERALNAFVAGYRPTEASLFVTRGALERFERAELQGVIGHEFSHILNGDMRLNIRLMAVLAGILLIGQMGSALIRSALEIDKSDSLRFSVGGRSGREGQDAEHSVALFQLLFGVVLMLIGYLGLFGGRLIKAALSRQREYLADAAAVQFTRDPSALTAALWRLQGDPRGTLLSTPQAEELSHFCIAQPKWLLFGRWFATHPPLERRIARVDPTFLPTRRAEAAQARLAAHDAAAQAEATAAAEQRAIDAPLSVSPIPPQLSAIQLTERIGNSGPAEIAYAGQIAASLGIELSEALHQPAGAKLICYAQLLLGSDSGHQRPVLREIAAREGKEAVERTLRLAKQLRGLGAEAQLPLFELAVPALRRLEAAERRSFLRRLRRLAEIDQRYRLDEVVRITLLKKYLREGPERPDRVTLFRLADGWVEIQTVLAALARAGVVDNAIEVIPSKRAEAQAQRAFEKALRPLAPTLTPLCLADHPWNGEAIERALLKLSGLTPLLKQALITACADAVLDDGVVTWQEAELMRAICESLDCPMPPLVTPE